jgi:hypothetical protein
MKLQDAFALVSVVMLCAAACAPAEAPESATAFSYDETALAGATPWTSAGFQNDPDEFQFVIIGDRTGGANVEGTFALAVDQLNLLQPEFVINVGDLIEGYSDDAGDLRSEGTRSLHVWCL